MRIVQLEQTDEITPNRTTEYVWDSTGVQSLANLPTGPTAKLLNETITTGKDTDEFGVTLGGGNYSYVYLNNQRLMRYETKTSSTGANPNNGTNANTTTRTIKSTYLNDPLGTMIGLKIQDPAEDPQPPTRTNPNPPSAQMNYYQYSPQGTMEAINAFKAYRPDGLYTGKSWDGDTTKLNYFHNRYQDAYDSPMISQDLVSPDLTQPLSLNEYLFCLNNPFAYLDPDGRSYVEFYRDEHELKVFDTDHNFLASFPAANEIDSSAKGHFPIGSYPFSHLGLLSSSMKNPNGPYGTISPFNFAVPNRENLAIHAGRESSGGYMHPTMGCIRTTEEAMSFLINLHGFDPVKTISVFQSAETVSVSLHNFKLTEDLTSFFNKVFGWESFSIPNPEVPQKNVTQ